MKTKICYLFLCLIISSNVYSQKVIHATSKLVDIRDGDVYFKNHWTIMPEIKPDIYQTSSLNKNITFYTDIDSISFLVEHDKTHEFIIVLDNTDSAYIQIHFPKNLSPCIRYISLVQYLCHLIF